MKIGFIILPLFAFSQQIALLKYDGGGDWYANPTALPNLIEFCNKEINTTLNAEHDEVIPGSSEIFNYPFVHMTGHGNVYFSDRDIKNLRNYLMAGGFLHIDDNYGMAEYLLPQLKKLFPNKTLERVPIDHPIFKKPYSFPLGLPKIHQHDGNAPEAVGFFQENRLLLLFTFETDLGDGWESAEIHNDPYEKRLEALKMGANIIHYVFNY